MTIQLEEVHYLTENAKKLAVLIEDQRVIDALAQHDLHNCRRVCRCRLVSHWFARGKFSHATSSNDVSTSTFEIEVFTSLGSINTKDVEKRIDGEFVNQLSDFHSGVGESTARALTTLAHTIWVHSRPLMYEAQPSMGEKHV